MFSFLVAVSLNEEKPARFLAFLPFSLVLSSLIYANLTTLYKRVKHYFAIYFHLFYCAPLHIFRPPPHNTLARVGACAMLLYMARSFTRGKTKPWGDNIRYPAHDHDQAVPLEDVRLEQFALLMARNAPMRRAVLTAFPNASAKATNYRAHKLMACKGVRERVEHLQAQIGLQVGQARNSAVGDVPPVASKSRPARGAWIETGDDEGTRLHRAVAPRAGRVD